MSDQNQVIDACKQDLCKLRSENLVSRISILERNYPMLNTLSIILMNNRVTM
jgi:hypothetical protein